MLGALLLETAKGAAGITFERLAAQFICKMQGERLNRVRSKKQLRSRNQRQVQIQLNEQVDGQAIKQAVAAVGD